MFDSMCPRMLPFLLLVCACASPHEPDPLPAEAGSGAWQVPSPPPWAKPIVPAAGAHAPATSTERFHNWKVLSPPLLAKALDDADSIALNLGVLRGSFALQDGALRTTAPAMALAVPKPNLNLDYYEFKVDFKREGAPDAWGYTLLYFNTANEEGVVSASVLLIRQTGKLELFSIAGTKLVQGLAGGDMPKDNQWHTASVVVIKGSVLVHMDGELVLTHTFDGPQSLQSGGVGIGSNGWNTSFRNLEVNNLDYWMLKSFAGPVRFVYHPQAEVPLKFTVESSRYPLSVAVEVTTPSQHTFSSDVSLLADQTVALHYPGDFVGADLAEDGKYGLRIVLPNFTLPFPTGDFEIKQRPLLAFVAAADIHVEKKYSLTNQPAAVFIDGINNERFFPRPGFVALAGDNVNTIESLAELGTTLEKLEVPYYIMPAAHDSVHETEGTRGKAFYEMFGDKYAYFMEWEGCVFVFTGAQCDYKPLTGGLGYYLGTDAFQAWLRSLLEGLPGRPVFLFNHLSPVQTRDAGGAENYWGPAEFAPEVLSLFDESKAVVAVFSGHDHVVSSQVVGGVTYVGTGPVQNPPFAYRYVEVYADEVFVHTIQFATKGPVNEFWLGSQDSKHDAANYTFGLPHERELTIKLPKSIALP